MNGEAASGGRRGIGGRKRGRAGGEMAVVRFAAFAAGVSVEDVTMVGGVHELAGSKRTVETAEERLVAQRGEQDERRERRERREQRREEEQRGVTAAGRAEQKRKKVEAVNERKDDEFGNDGHSENGGRGGAAAHGAHAGGWAAGGLGDRTGVG